MARPRPSLSRIYPLAAVLSFPLLEALGGCGGATPNGADAGAADAITPPSDVATAPDVTTTPDVGSAARDGSTCDDAACGPDPLGAPNTRCADGSIGGPTCGARADGTCGWYLRFCPMTPDAGGVCTLPDGRTCPAGTSCPAGDGCNTCSCDASGRAVCALRACPIDAGTTDLGAADVGAPDAEPCVPECAAPPPGCRYEGPISCDPPSCGRLVCPDAGAEIVCGASGGGTFPTFDRSCRASGDCAVAVHQTDCCGNSRAMGIDASQRDAFERAEAVCRPMYPRCRCPARPPVTDDGATSDSSTTIPVECRAGTCTTYQRP